MNKLRTRNQVAMLQHGNECSPRRRKIKQFLMNWRSKRTRLSYNQSQGYPGNGTDNKSKTRLHVVLLEQLLFLLLNLGQTFDNSWGTLELSLSDLLYVNLAPKSAKWLACLEGLRRTASGPYEYDN